LNESSISKRAVCIPAPHRSQTTKYGSDPASVTQRFTSGKIPSTVERLDNASLLREQRGLVPAASCKQPTPGLIPSAYGTFSKSGSDPASVAQRFTSGKIPSAVERPDNASSLRKQRGLVPDTSRKQSTPVLIPSAYGTFSKSGSDPASVAQRFTSGKIPPAVERPDNASLLRVDARVNPLGVWHPFEVWVCSCFY